MKKTVLFAVSRTDAMNKCEEEGLVFEDTVWVLNAQLLGDTVKQEDVAPVYTDLFREMPAYGEAEILFGPGGDSAQ